MEKWVSIAFPERLSGGLSALAHACGWRVKLGDPPQVCLEENYQNQPPKLIVARRLADASNATESKRYERFASWPPQDQYIPEEARASGLNEVQRRLELGTQNDTLSAVQLLWMLCADETVAHNVQEYYTHPFVRGLPQSSLWVVEINRRLHQRSAAMRTLFAALEVPEVLDRPREEFEGFLSGRGLQTTSMFGLESFFDPALICVAPWALGFMSYRLGGAIVVMFGQPYLARNLRNTAEAIDLYAPRGILSEQLPSPPDRPTPSASDAEALLAWWVRQLNLLQGHAYDPANFADERGFYDARRHFAFIPSLERLFACVHSELFETRKNEFTRKLLLFQALDILDGLGVKDTRTLTELRYVRGRVEWLRRTLPETVGRVLLPRCEAAAQALADTAKGFWVRERISSEGLITRNKKGLPETLTMDHAVADFMRVVRNTGHSFKNIVADPKEISLLASHDGYLPNDLADLAFLHLLCVMADPASAIPRPRRRAVAPH